MVAALTVPPKRNNSIFIKSIFCKKVVRFEADSWYYVTGCDFEVLKLLIDNSIVSVWS